MSSRRGPYSVSRCLSHRRGGITPEETPRRRGRRWSLAERVEGLVTERETDPGVGPDGGL